MGSRPPSDQTRRSLGCIVLFAVPFVIGGIAVSVHGAHEVADALASRSWPMASARIVSSRVSEQSDSESTTYTADVRFEFVVDGVTHAGSRIRFGAWSGSADRARAALRPYPVGTVVDARYRPGAPDDAVLEPGAGFGAYAIVAFGVLFVLVGGGIPALILVAERRRWRAEAPAASRPCG